MMTTPQTLIEELEEEILAVEESLRVLEDRMETKEEVLLSLKQEYKILTGE